jgi:hypothetical protein
MQESSCLDFLGFEYEILVAAPWSCRYDIVLESKRKEGDDTQEIYKSADQTHHLWPAQSQLA